MILFSYENIFDIHDADLRVVPVNIAGSMGAGLAKAFGTRYPDLLLEYVSACKKHRFRKTSSLLYRPDGEAAILCVPTKIHWKNKSTEEQIVTSMKLIERCMIANPSFNKEAMPALGCGLGDFPLRRWMELAREHFAKQEYTVKFLMHGMKPVILDFIDDVLIVSVDPRPDHVEVDLVIKDPKAVNFIHELFENNELIGISSDHQGLFAFLDISLFSTADGTLGLQLKLTKITHTKVMESMYPVSF